MSRSLKLRLAVVGGVRGASFQYTLSHLCDRVELTAIVDPDPIVRARWRSEWKDIGCYTEMEQLLADDVCDAVLIATPMLLHAEQSLQAIESGKHVLCEVPACLSHDEGLRLIDAVGRSDVTFMMAENVNYMRAQMMVLNMVRKGVLGDLTYAEGMYLHDCRDLCFHRDGSLTWRGMVHARRPAGGNTYPTHPFGPIAWWLGLNKTDKMRTIYSVTSSAHGMADYAARTFGTAHAGATPAYWRRGDSTTCVIKTEAGRVIQIRSDMASARPMHNQAFELQGTAGCVRSAITRSEQPLVWLDGRSIGNSPPAGHAIDSDARTENPQWEALFKYADEFEHPRWRAQKDIALRAGHDGSDFFVLQDFLDAVDQRIENPIDVYDSVSWSSIIWLSGESERRGTAVLVTDYSSQTTRSSQSIPVANPP